MTEGKVTHTAGPWEMGRDGLGISVDADGVPVCMCDGPVEDNEANARLIASAPDLLEACEMIWKAWLRTDPGAARNDVFGCAAAIAKATGTTHD